MRLVTDPAPPGVGWTYSGLDVPFELGVTASERSITLTPGTYQVAERPTQAGQPSTLTALSCTDADGNTRVRIATASVVVGLEEGETVVCTFRHRALGRRSAAAALARAYAPLLRLSSGEPYRPLRIEDYLAGSSLRGGSPPRGTLLQPHPTLFSLPTASGRSYLDVAGGEPYSRPSPYPGLEQKLRSTRPRPTVYWHLVRDPGSGRVAIEYWLLYLYDDFSDKHEADWEGITVVLDGETPFGVSYSAHQGRRWSAWSEQSASGTHPVVYVAPGLARELPAFWRVRRPRLLDALRPPLHTDPKDRLGDRHWWLARPVDIRPARVRRRCLQRKLGVRKLRSRRWPDPGPDHRPAPPLGLL